MTEALFFDAAGTLIKTTESVGETYARLLSGHGYILEPESLQKRFVEAFRNAGDPDYESHADGGAAERSWWRRVVELTLGEAVSDPIFDTLFEHYAQPDAWQVIPGVEHTLDRAAENGFRLAVISNFDRRLRPILAGLGLASRFEVIVTSADACCRKPDPSIFHYALDLMGLSPDQVRHVGDSEGADGEGAAAAGLQALVLQPNGARLEHFVDQAISGNRK